MSAIMTDTAALRTLRGMDAFAWRTPAAAAPAPGAAGGSETSWE